MKSKHLNLIDIMSNVIELVSDFTGFPKNEINAKTRLGEDLGIDGQDAYDFIEQFSETFNVDMQNFCFDVHFGPEASFDPFSYLYFLLFNRKKIQMIPVTIEHLVKCAKSGKWL